MKTTFSILLFAAITLVSCKKDYTCECTTTSHTPEFNFGGTIIQQESTSTSSASSTINDKKDEAKSTCESQNGTTTIPSQYAQVGAEPTTVTVACSIQD